MADRMDEILRTVADEADRGVDYVALHDAIFVAHKKEHKSFSRMARTLSYAAAFVALIGLGALALSGGFLSGASPDAASGGDALRAAEGVSEASEAMPAEFGPAPAGADDNGDMPKLAADESGETPMLGSSSGDAPPAALSLLSTEALAAEVLEDENAVSYTVAALKNEPERGAAGQPLTDEFTCNSSYKSLYIEPLEGAPALSVALVSDRGNGELHIYWSASNTLHVYSCTIGYTAEDAIALLAQIG